MTRSDKHHGEVELKFELDREAAKAICHHDLLAEAGHHSVSQSTVYFDTEAGDLHKAGYSLRVRRAGDRITQTVKTDCNNAGLFDRGEWEAPVQQMEPDPKAVRQTPLGKLKRLKRDLEPVVQSEVERTNWLINHNGSVVEVVLDSGCVSAGDEEARFQELELELKGGQPAAMFDIARELGEAIPLEIGVLSKEQRGLMLADGSFGHEHKASSPHIDKAMDAGQVFAQIVHECIRHFRLNEALIVTNRDPNALHQARVAMRRLRTAFSLFRPAIRQEALDPLRRELRWFIRPLGKARNLDVFLANLGSELASRDRRRLQSARAKAYDEVIEALNGQRSRNMILNLVEWTALGDWQKDAASTPIRKFAAKRLDAAWRKVRRKGSKLRDLEEKQLHRFRIGIKNLRYAVEFLGPLYGKKMVRKYASSLEEMQDCLGLLHDNIISREIVAHYGLEVIARTDVIGRAHQLKVMERRFKRLKRAGRFWSN